MMDKDKLKEKFFRDIRKHRENPDDLTLTELLSIVYEEAYNEGRLDGGFD